MSNGPFSWFDFKVLTDETLPPDYVKFLNGDKATVFRIDVEDEHAQPVAEWPEVPDEQKVEDR